MLLLGETLLGEIMGADAVFIPPPPPPPPSYLAIAITGLRTGGDAAPSTVPLRGGSTIVTYAASGDTKIFLEGQPDFLEWTFVGEDGAPIDQAVVTDIRATLKNSAGTVINQRDNQPILNANGGAWIGPGRFRQRLFPSDMVSVGTHEYQHRELTIRMLYGDGSPWHWMFLFTLRNLRSI